MRSPVFQQRQQGPPHLARSKEPAAHSEHLQVSAQPVHALRTLYRTIYLVNGPFWTGEAGQAYTELVERVDPQRKGA